MKRLFAYSVAASALLTLSSLTSAATLVDMTNIPAQVSTPSATLDSTQSFVATSNSTVLTIEGYDVPASFVLVNLLLGTTAAPATNVLGAHFTYTAAPCSPLAGEGNLGTHGTYDLSFRGGCVGGYDSFAQTISTTIGTTYNLSYIFTLVASSGRAGTALPNGLRITANEPGTPAVPEPTTWAMMLVGFGGIGMAMRRRRAVAVSLAKTA